MSELRRKEMLKWFDKRITQLALGLPENEWKYSDKQKAQEIRLLIDKYGNWEGTRY